MRSKQPVRVLGLAALSMAMLIAACNDDNDVLNDDELTPEPEVNDDTALNDDPADATSLTMVDIDFEPDEVTAATGEVIELQVTNDGGMEHSFTIDEIDADVEVTGNARQEGNDADVDVWLGGGESGTLQLEVHESGEYEFYCAVPGHAEAGQVGTLVVE